MQTSLNENLSLHTFWVLESANPRKELFIWSRVITGQNVSNNKNITCQSCVVSSVVTSKRSPSNKVSSALLR